MTTDKTPATLATAKPGGCVQLPTSERERFEAWAESSGEGLSRWPDGLYVRQATQVAWDAWQAALSAQPSPGGQGDALLESLVARWRNHAEEIGVSDNLLCQKIANCTMRHAAELQAALAARQPVGEPVAYIEHFTDQLSRMEMTLHGLRLGIGKHAVYAARPAQAVDLPYSLDADPAGIRARVADCITGTLMVGAQGHTPPPAGHWAEPFWQAARADAGLQVKMREALWAAAKSLRTIADSTKDTEFLETASEIRAYANSRANCAEQALTDSQAVRNG